MSLNKKLDSLTAQLKDIRDHSALETFQNDFHAYLVSSGTQFFENENSKLFSFFQLYRKQLSKVHAKDGHPFPLDIINLIANNPVGKKLYVLNNEDACVVYRHMHDPESFVSLFDPKNGAFFPYVGFVVLAQELEKSSSIDVELFSKVFNHLRAFCSSPTTIDPHLGMLILCMASAHEQHKIDFFQICDISNLPLKTWFIENSLQGGFTADIKNRINGNVIAEECLKMMESIKSEQSNMRIDPLSFNS